ncbi:hypothetical protein PCE1_002834 [Barthelona sp. PCE]
MKIILLCLLLVAAYADRLSCIDPSGKPVDWFAMLKIPKLKNHPNPMYKKGYGYMYFDARSEPKWIPDDSKNLRQNTDGAAQTLKPLYANPYKYAHIMYNDHPPTGKISSIFGHAKGVVGLGNSGGFWLIHSVPRYPFPLSQEYEYPEMAAIYGQSFMCSSFNIDQFNKIGHQLQLMKPGIFDRHTPAWLSSLAPELHAVFNDVSLDEIAMSNVEPLVTAGGQKLIHLAKNRKWASELYVDLMAPTFHSDVLSETWMRPALPSACKPSHKYSAENIEFVKYTEEVAWKYTKDHSKWGITKSGTVSCIGGINRMSSQAKRPGGAMCIDFAKLHKAFMSAVDGIQSC